MPPATPEPLWREMVGDTEPWRRGRIALIIFGALTLLDQGCVLARDVLGGNIEHLLGVGISVLFFWVQFYFIWIGVHWVRWLNAAFSGLAGFAFLIWGFRDGSALLICSGAYLFAMAAYVGLAPSVYFFAQRQRERSRWMENLVVGAVMLLLLASCAAAALGLAAYRNARVAEGRKFADRAFRQIFTDHDDEFLIKHATARTLENNGKLRWQQMTSDVYARCGKVHDISPAQGRLRCWYKWPATIVSGGRMHATATGDHGRLILQLDLGEAGGDWQIDGVWWSYPPR